DARGCTNGTSCRPAILFGRYGSSSRDRLDYSKATPEFQRIKSDPRPEWLRAAGYTHVYLDSSWWGQLTPESRARVRGGAFAVLGSAGVAGDFRALLRVCDGVEPCALNLPGLLEEPPDAPPPAQ